MLLAADLSGANPLLLALVAGVTTFLLFRARRQFARLNRDGRASAAPVRGPADQIAETARNMEVQLHDRMREVQGQLDTKLATLNQLILDAERQATRLEALLKRMQSETHEETNTTEAEEGPAAAAVGAPPPTESRPDKALQHRHGQVYDLADEGYSATAIARRLDSTPGEVELILGLRRRGSYAAGERGRHATGQIASPE